MRWGLIVVMLLLPCLAWAQEQGDTEITGVVGWQYGGTQDFVGYSGYSTGDFHADAAMDYGGTLSHFIKDAYAIEIAYTYQKTDLLVRPAGLPGAKVADLATHYIQLYGCRYVPVRPDKVDAFLMGGVGATCYSPTSTVGGIPSNISSRWVTSFGIGGGLRLNTSDRIALRLQTRLLIPIQWSNSSFYFGSGGGSITVGGSSTLIQGDTTLGLVVKLGSRS